MTQKTHIIISNYDDLENPYYAGGGALAVHTIAKHLSEKHTVTVITGTYPGAKAKIRDGVTYKRVGMAFLGPKLGQLIYSLSLPFLVITERYEAWLECFTPPFSTNFLQVFTKKPIIAVVHMFAATDMKRKYGFLPFEFIEHIGLKTYKHAIVVTEEAKRLFLKKNPRCTVTCIPNGVEKHSVNNKQEERYMLFLGRLEVNQKGLDLLLKAFAQVKEAIPYDLVIAGSGIKAEEEKMRSYIADLHIEDRVRLLGRVEQEKKDEVLTHAAFVIMPSRYESFGLVALEALSFGKPVITFDIPMLSWIPGTCSVKVKAFDEASLADAMRRLAHDGQLRKTMGKEALKIADLHSWDAVAKEYSKVIEKVIG